MIRAYPAKDRYIDKAAESMKKGGLVIYPTETCYGLGTSALNRVSVNEIYRAKKRSRRKPLTMIVGDLETAERFADLNRTERLLIDAFMPGPLTIVAEPTDRFPTYANDKFVFRIPGKELTRQLAQKAGVPLIATSANLSGEGPHYRIKDIDDDVLEHCDMVLEGGRLDATPPSTIVEATLGEVRILRHGPITAEQIEVLVNE